MKPSEVQCVYWGHGRFDSDFQDQVFDTVMPDFFVDVDTNNLLGIEDAGAFTDQERDDLLRRAERDPVGGLTTDTIDEIRNAAMSRVIYLVTILTDMSNGCLLSREAVLLRKWNTENPGRIVLPYRESYPTDKIRDEIGAVAEDILSVSFLKRDVKISWRTLANFMRKKAEVMAEFVMKRNSNWLRMLRDLTLQAEQAKTRFKILITLGSLHFQLTDELRRELSDKLIIRDDIVFPDFARPTLNGLDHLVYKKLCGHDSSDEDYLRSFLFTTMETTFVYGADQDRTGFYVVDRDKLADVWRSCMTMPVEEIAPLFGLSLDEDPDRDEKKDCIVTEKVLHEDFLNDIRRPGVDGSFLLDRRNHPNNLYIDKLCVINLLCYVLKVADSDDGMISLLRQIVDKILPQKIIEMRKGICESFSSDTMQVPPTIARLIKLISLESPKNPRLWKDTSKKNGTSGRLIGLARKCLADTEK